MTKATAVAWGTYSFLNPKELFCSGQIDAAPFQPTEVGFVTPAEGFSPAGGGVQHVIDYNRRSLFSL
jgi:hypothetical protein